MVKEVVVAHQNHITPIGHEWLIFMWKKFDTKLLVHNPSKQFAAVEEPPEYVIPAIRSLLGYPPDSSGSTSSKSGRRKRTNSKKTAASKQAKGKAEHQGTRTESMEDTPVSQQNTTPKVKSMVSHLSLDLQSMCRFF
eukprot:gb/GECH01007786.1/.p1 GENE.gb/GECH01007786.1/~~gb/GECH01007786.1/.p1  ORF type:complete len:137 (+),score=10.94 gb/GECH01007786.1/:1-411(+)